MEIKKIEIVISVGVGVYGYLPASAFDNQFLLVRPESDWYFDKPSKTCRLGRK